MPPAMMITNRNVDSTELGGSRDQLRYYMSEKTNLSSSGPV